MEWRQQTSVSCADAFTEAQRWIEEVTGKSFGCSDFRAALENGVLLCDLINQLKPGIIKRVNRLSTPIAGLDNVNVFLKACGKLGLNDSQLFHPGDLQDLSTRVMLRRDESNRRLKNVLITIYWLGRKAHLDAFYSGPQLNFKAFEGLLGLALSKVLDEGSGLFVKDGGYKEYRYPEKEEYQRVGPSIESLDSQTLRPNSDGCGSDAEAEQVFKMENLPPSVHQNQGYVPAPQQRQQGQEENGTGCASPLSSATVDAPLSSQPRFTVSPPERVIDEELFLRALWDEDSEDDHAEADPVLDDLYLRRVQQTLRQTTSNPDYDRFLPRYWTPEEESRVRTIYLGSQKRPWYRKLQSLSHKALALTEEFDFISCNVTSAPVESIPTTPGEPQTHTEETHSTPYQIQVRPQRPVQVNPGWIWSKSLSDIPMVYPARKAPDGNTVYAEGRDAGLAGEWSRDNTRQCSVAAKDSEAQWQDDFTKWKNRRRSTKSELHRKSYDREHVITQMTTGAKPERSEGLTKRDQQFPWRHNPAPRPYSTSPPSKSSSFDIRPRARALLARSYATESPFSPTAPLSRQHSDHTWGSFVGAMPASDGNILREETRFASLPSDGARVTTPTLDCPYSSQTQVKAQGSPAVVQSTSVLAQQGNIVTNQISTLVTTLQPHGTKKSTSTKDLTSSMAGLEILPFSVETKVKTFCPDTVNQAGVDALEDSYQNYKFQEWSQKTSQDPAGETGRAQQAAGMYTYWSRAGSWSGSASLPRGYRRSDSCRLSSAITARPFGTKQSRVSSLPRLSSVEQSQSLLSNSDKEDSLSSPSKSSLKRQTATAHLKGQHQASIRQKKANQARQNSAEQGKEVSGASVSSQTSCHINGHPHQTQILAQPYSNPVSHHNKSSTLPSKTSADLPKMDHSDMRVSLTLKPNSVPDFGFQTHWDSTGVKVTLIQPASPAELCQLCVDDEIVAVDGVEVAHMNYNQWKDKMASALQTGNLSMDIRHYGNKDWSAGDGSHHNLPRQSRVTLNLTAAAPALNGSPDRHANSAASTETTLSKVSKFNGQTDNVVLAKVTDGGLSDNQRTAAGSKDYNNIAKRNQIRRAEFFTQKGGSESAISDLQVPSLSPSSSSWSWDREEDRRRQEKWQEEQERLLQEQYQRDQQRLEAAWQRAQQDAVEVRKLGQNTVETTTGGETFASTLLHVNGLKKTREEEQIPEKAELKEMVEKSQTNAQEMQSDRITEKDWADGSCGFAQLSPAHRTKSLSTPVLAGLHKQTKADPRKTKGQSVSKAEQDRQLILEEMKKRTQLLTDNSWIRQRSSSFYKEPVYVGVPMKRYESLDNLDTLRQSPAPAPVFTYPRPHSAAAGYCAPTRNSSSRYSTGGVLSQRNVSMDSPHPARMVNGRRSCCVCGRVLGSGAAMVIEALSLCFHLACFQCVGCRRRLRGTEAGVQVRVRNGKPYCEPCYFQLKSTGDLPM